MKRLLALLVALTFSYHAYATELPTLPARVTTLKGKKITFTLEVAATSADRTRGLMERTTLEPHDGMVFWFPKVAVQKFWMKNTPIPLDVLFVNRAGTIIQITQAKALSEEPFGPDTPVATVIELEAGRAKIEGINVGDRVDYGLATEPKNLAN